MGMWKFGRELLQPKLHACSNLKVMRIWMVTTSLQFVGNDYSWLFKTHTLCRLWSAFSTKGLMCVKRVNYWEAKLQSVWTTVSSGVPFITLCIIWFIQM